jgi:hypothetical protein
MSNSIKPQKEIEKEIFGTLDSASLSLIEDDAMSFGAQETLNISQHTRHATSLSPNSTPPLPPISSPALPHHSSPVTKPTQGGRNPHVWGPIVAASQLHMQLWPLDGHLRIVSFSKQSLILEIVSQVS